MKQQSILQSGCQEWNKNVLDSGGDNFAYCATVGVYSHSLKCHNLKQLHPAHERTITGITWSRKHPNRYISCAVDNEIREFDVDKEEFTKSFPLPDNPIMVDSCWAEGHTSNIAVLVKPGEVFVWDTESEMDPLKQIENMPTEGCRCVRWDTTSNTPRLAVGYKDGSVFIWDKQLNSVANIPCPREFAYIPEQTEFPVTDIQWDPLSNIYLVVTYEGGHMALLNVENLNVQTLFNRKHKKIEMTAFVKAIPGGFLSIERPAPLLTLWNVSTPDAEELVRIPSKRVGMVGIKVSSDPNTFILAFCDGSVGLYDFSVRRLVWTTQPGHSETIFDLQFKPTNHNIIATASYDSTVKIWSTENMTLLNTLKTNTAEDLGYFYSVTWGPPGETEDRVLAGSSLGNVLMWDTVRQTVLKTFQVHTKPVFRALWNPNDNNMIASVSSDGYAVVFDMNGKILMKYKHPEAVYGCDWSPFDNKKMLLTGCFDGIVRVFDVSDLHNAKPIHQFSGHKARVFNVKWSPLLPGYFASGSDDRTVKVWRIGQPHPVFEMLGHENSVRALCWSHEVPYLLLSGAWDCTVRVWDIRSRHEKCQHIITNHIGDVYGLHSHPDRPFVFATCSRDTTLRLWSMDQTFMAGLKYQVVLANAWIQPEHMLEARKLMGPDDKLHLAGVKSSELAAFLESVSMEDREAGKSFQRLIDFWRGPQGYKELFSLAFSLIESRAGDYEGDVVHIDDLRRLIGVKANDLLSTKFNMDQGSHKDRMKKAANIKLKLGKIKEYCEIMIKIGEWEHAISIAPCQSLAYWQQLANRYANHLMEQRNDHAMPYLISTGESAKLIHYEAEVLYRSPIELTEALTTAVGEAVDSLPTKQDEDEEDEEEKKDEDGEREEVFVSERVKMVLDLQAKRYRDAGQPIYSACCYLAMGDTQRAIQRLINGNEIMLAIIVMKILKEDQDFVWQAAATRSEHLELWHEALVCLHNLSEPLRPVTLLACRYIAPINSVADFYLKCGIVNTLEEYKEQAQSTMSDPAKISETVLALVASRQFAKGAELGLDFVRKNLTAGTGTWKELTEVFEPLESIPLDTDHCLLETGMRFEILAMSCYFGLQRAIWREYTSIVTFLATAIEILVQRHDLSLPVSLSQIKMMLASYYTASDPSKATTIVNELVADAAAPPKIKAGALALKKTLETYFPTPSGAAIPVEDTSMSVPTGSTIPGASHRKMPFASTISFGKPVTGTRVIFGPTHELQLSESDAHMLLDCTPFCPSLNGDRLNIFHLQYYKRPSALRPETTMTSTITLDTHHSAGT